MRTCQMNNESKLTKWVLFSPILIMLYIKNKPFFHWLPWNIKQHNANSLLRSELWLAFLLSTVVDGSLFHSFAEGNLNIKFSKSFSMTDTKTCCWAPESHCLGNPLDSIPLISWLCPTVSGLAWLFDVFRPRHFFLSFMQGHFILNPLVFLSSLWNFVYFLFSFSLVFRRCSGNMLSCFCVLCPLFCV